MTVAHNIRKKEMQGEQVFAKNTPVWIPHESNGYVAGTLLEDYDAKKTASNVRFVLEESQTESNCKCATTLPIERRIAETSAQGPDDLSTLVHLSNASLLEALSKRHAAKQVYTSVGPILVSINPFERLPELYDEATQAKYLKSAEEHVPHVYKTAAAAFAGATRRGQNQSVIFSGESGAGKTEATKILIHFLVYASSQSSVNANSGSAAIRARLTSANPLIEAFGNAKTTRNDNSSRFAGYTEIQFDNNHEISGATVTGFNLEKSRVVTRGELQQNFHVFYGLVASTDELRGKSFAYLNNEIPSASETKSRCVEFESTLKAMQSLGLESDAVMRVVQGVLELGNVQFIAVEHLITHEESSAVALISRETLERVCRLWGTNYAALEQALTIRDLSNSKEEIYKPHTKAQAEQARDALAKHTYGRVFDWIMDRVNRATIAVASASADFDETAPPKQGSIGLLDTYGFEVFAKNSFEQFCINYCNERIMSLFNDTCIKSEYALYAAEGVELPGHRNCFKDRTQACLYLMGKPNHGLFTMLDDEIIIPQGSDLNLVRKYRDIHRNDANFVPHVSELKNAQSKYLFGVEHFAGVVHYSVQDFLDKNRDTLPTRLERVVAGADGFLGEELFTTESFSQSSSPRRLKASKLSLQHSTSARAAQKVSLGARFRLQLDSLMIKIVKTETHFVRCIKPNDENVAEKFQGRLVLDQLNFGGVLETCRLRKDGFAVRRTHADFLATYGKFARHASGNAQELACTLRDRYGVAVEMGKTTAFLRDGDFARLEHAALQRETNARSKLQAFGRLVVEKKKQSERAVWMTSLRQAVKDLNETKINQLLLGDDFKRLFTNGSCQALPLIKEATRVAKCLKVEMETEKELILFSKELVQLKELVRAVACAERLDHDLTGRVAKALVGARCILNGLLAVEASKSNGVAQDQACRVLQRSLFQFVFARKIRSAFAELKSAWATQDHHDVHKAVKRLQGLGLGSHPDVMRASKMLPARKHKDRQVERALESLDEAVRIARFKTSRISRLNKKDVAPLSRAICAARIEEVPEEQLGEAMRLEREMMVLCQADAATTKRKWWMMFCCTASAVQVLKPLKTTKPYEEPIGGNNGERLLL